MEFIDELFRYTEAPVFICSLPNEKNDPTEADERHLTSRDPGEITSFAAQWDRPKRGAFFCVSTMRGARRNKASALETAFLHVDIDFKDVDDSADTILRRLSTLPLPPSVVVSSGNGLHCYWLLTEAVHLDSTVEVERVEAALKLLSDLCGADNAVTHVAALMRLPGTHNSKRGEWREVEVVGGGNGRYDLTALEEMLATTSPVVLRKVRPMAVNAFAAYAEQHLGFKPPLDVEKRLQGMCYMGGGEAAIHSTQLAVTASLLNAGRSVDEVVTLVLDATRAAAGAYGERWNWAKEERAVREMCGSWAKKHPPQRMAPGGATVLQLSDERAKRERAEPAPQSTKDQRERLHVIVGQTLLKVKEDSGEPILNVGEQLWSYSAADGVWREAGKGWLEMQIEIVMRALDRPSTIKGVTEAARWIMRNPEIWRAADGWTWDGHGKIAVRCGLIDPVSAVLISARADHYATTRLDCTFEPGAACTMFLSMLEVTFADRDPATRASIIALLQEWLGAALIEDKAKALTRALVLHGPSNTGKSDIIRVLSGLLTDRPISTPLSALDGAHGLEEFHRKAPWVLHEAFSGGKWHFSDVVKAILSGDPVHINRKYNGIITKRIRQPVVWGTNFPPQFREATKAIVNRMVVIKTAVVFDPEAPVGAAAEARRLGYAEPSEMILALERPGLLNWALAGLQRLLARGYFATNAEMKETLETIRADSNIALSFLDECCSYGAGCMITISDFCAAFAVHYAEAKGDDKGVPSNESISRALMALGDPRIGLDSNKLRDTTHRYYVGIHLNRVGLKYWNGAVNDGMAKGKVARTSRAETEVNRIVPEKWRHFDVVMRVAREAARVAALAEDETACRQSDDGERTKF